MEGPLASSGTTRKSQVTFRAAAISDFHYGIDMANIILMNI